MKVEPYLVFNGRCEEAIEFYRKTLGAEVQMMMRFRECPDTTQSSRITPGTEDKIMHASLKIGDTVLMASDGLCKSSPTFEGFSLSLTVPDVDKAEKLFAALGDGGQVQMPLTPTFYSPSFGMLSDRFGVTWMIMVHA